MKRLATFAIATALIWASFSSLDAQATPSTSDGGYAHQTINSDSVTQRSDITGNNDNAKYEVSNAVVNLTWPNGDLAKLRVALTDSGGGVLMFWHRDGGVSMLYQGPRPLDTIPVPAAKRVKRGEVGVAWLDTVQL